MKLVLAFVKPHKVTNISRALRSVPVSGMTMMSVQGWGGAKRHAQETEHAAQISDFEEYARIEIACSDAVVHQVVSVLESAAHTGLRGDGKIYVLPLEEAMRISTGERGENIC